MLDVRPFDGLGKFRNGWLNATHHFSFGEYHNPRRISFGPLRVWNDDTIQPGTGFDMHGHRDMEMLCTIKTTTISKLDLFSISFRNFTNYTGARNTVTHILYIIKDFFCILPYSRSLSSIHCRFSNEFPRAGFFRQIEPLSVLGKSKNFILHTTFMTSEYVNLHLTILLDFYFTQLIIVYNYI